MSKAKGQYGYDNRMELTGKAKKVDPDTGKEKEPGAALMDMMKDMYDNGDDNLRKTLGEAMLKSKQNEAMGKSVADDDFDTDKY